jgi:hypothetical protein
MGMEVDVFRLYRLSGNTELLILAHAGWPEYPNSFGGGYSWASDILEARFDLLFLYASKSLEFKNANLLGESYTCTGGDIFDEACDKSDFKEVSLEIWVAFSMSQPKQFAFGIHPDETEFWQELNDSMRREEFGPFSRPARKTKVLYLR